MEPAGKLVVGMKKGGKGLRMAVLERAICTGSRAAQTLQVAEDTLPQPRRRRRRAAAGPPAAGAAARGHLDSSTNGKCLASGAEAKRQAIEVRCQKLGDSVSSRGQRLG